MRQLTRRERGVLLLCCALGDPHVRPLSAAAFLRLERLLAAGRSPVQPDTELTPQLLQSLGLYGPEAERVYALLERERQLDAYLNSAARLGIQPVTRLSAAYPRRLLQQLRQRAPMVLFCRGEVDLLRMQGISLVGSRQLRPAGEAFARRVGELCAQEQLVLISGGASGADRTAQRACSAAGGAALIFVADQLTRHVPDALTLYCSEDGFGEPFTAPRAHARNRLIHAQGEAVFVAQTNFHHGGTWTGTAENLQKGYSPVFCHDDGSPGAQALCEQGATPLRYARLTTLRGLQSDQSSFF